VQGLLALLPWSEDTSGKLGPVDWGTRRELGIGALFGRFRVRTALCARVGGEPGFFVGAPLSSARAQTKGLETEGRSHRPHGKRLLRARTFLGLPGFVPRTFRGGLGFARGVGFLLRRESLGAGSSSLFYGNRSVGPGKNPSRSWQRVRENTGQWDPGVVSISPT